jgi:hypothetical protein
VADTSCCGAAASMAGAAIMPDANVEAPDMNLEGMAARAPAVSLPNSWRA